MLTESSTQLRLRLRVLQQSRARTLCGKQVLACSTPSALEEQCNIDRKKRCAGTAPSTGEPDHVGKDKACSTGGTRGLLRARAHCYVSLAVYHSPSLVSSRVPPSNARHPPALAGASHLARESWHQEVRIGGCWNRLCCKPTARPGSSEVQKSCSIMHVYSSTMHLQIPGHQAPPCIRMSWQRADTKGAFLR